MDRFDKAIDNFKLVKNSALPKFERLDCWLEKESALYKSEIKTKEKKYVNLKRGTIIKVDFGVNPGSELCHTHFAIVLSKFDNTKQESIIVLPLTSKPGVGRIPLNNLIKNEIIKKIKKNWSSQDDSDQIDEIITSYKKYTNFSYAYISQITTISKSRLIYSANKFDILNKTRCSKEILNKIDSEIVSYITGFDIVVDPISKEPLVKI